MPWETTSNFWEQKPETRAQISGKTEIRTLKSQCPALVTVSVMYMLGTVLV